MSFRFSGRVPASKSILNRLLVIQSFAREPLEIRGDSSCDDVVAMRRALPAVLASHGGPADCGAAGTTFRFLALRASRVPGRHVLTGTPALLARPQKALVEALAQLGVGAELTPAGLVIESAGWKPPAGGRLRIDRSQSSQFASAVLLSAWELDFDLRLQLAEGPSEGYLAMSEDLVRRSGMRLERSPSGEIAVPRGSQVTAQELAAESDLSSCFAVAALAALDLGSSARFEEFPRASLQPDRVFVRLLDEMGADVRRDDDGSLTIRGAEELSPIEVDLGESPDLFPVLAVLCAFAEGTSHLYGAPHLAYKESSRIEKTAELLRGLGREIEVRRDGMIIHGHRVANVRGASWDFDPSDDHRLAMAAAVARQAGEPVRVLHPEVVAKSFPEFWPIVAGGAR